MISSVCRVFLKASKLHVRQLSTSGVKNSGGKWYYRVGPDPPARHLVWIANGLGGFMWWWIFWHIWHEPEHLYGSFPGVDASKWTNDELGIPEDDVD